MTQLLIIFRDICLLKATPQDLPISSFLLMLAIIAYFITGLIFGILGLSFNLALAHVTLDIIVMTTFFGLILRITGFQARFLQSATALFGSACILTIVEAPFAFLGKNIMVANGIVLPSLILYFLIIWNFVVIGHILRHTLAIPFFLGFFLAITYIIIEINIAVRLLPQTV